MDYARLAESRNLIGGELQLIGRDYGHSACITSTHLRMDESSARAPGTVRSRVRSFSDPDHELVIFVVGRDLVFPRLADSRFPSRTHTCETHALLLSHSSDYCFMHASHDVCPPRCDALRQNNVNLRSALPKLNCHSFQGMDRKPREKIRSSSIKFSGSNTIAKNSLKATVNLYFIILDN